MRVIDMFRTPKQREIIAYLEKNHLCRVSDVGDISNYHKHFRALLEEGVIYICGYVGCKNQQVYALCSRRDWRNGCCSRERMKRYRT